MTVFQQVQREIECQPGGALFTLADFSVAQEQAGAVAKALSRLKQQGRLLRLMKGLYFKPYKGILGDVTLPSYDIVVQKLLELYKNKISYITGVNVYSGMSLTTQISSEFVIATDKPRRPLSLAGNDIRFVRSYVTEAIPASNVSLVQLLDAMGDIKRIPATRPAKAARVLRGQLRRLSAEQRQSLAHYALEYYPPQTRALAGLLLENLDETELAQPLKDSLNPLTVFQLGLDSTDFPTSRNWNIL